MIKRKPIVGETLYSLNIGNAARYKPQQLTPVVVVSVGRKYFDCKAGGRIVATRFHLSTWTEKTDYSADEKLYETPEQWEEEELANDLLKRIRTAFDHCYSIYNSEWSIDQIRRIAAILDENKKGE